jgi:hypothetical protein
MHESEKRYVNCPECGNEMSAHALLCRECYKRAGGVGAAIYRAAAERGEASPRWNKEARSKRHPEMPTVRAKEQTMGFDQYAVIKVRGVEPEVFWIVWMDSELPINSFIKTSQNLTEAEVRAELERMSINESGIDALIKRARENPR